MSRIQAVAWNSDLQKVVLEVPDESGKGTQDSEVCSWRQLLTELAESSIADPTINSHELRSPLAAEVGQGFSSLIYLQPFAAKEKHQISRNFLRRTNLFSSI